MKRITLAITGASGALYAKRFLDTVLPQKDIELWVVSSAHGVRIFKEELDLDLREFVPDLKSPKDFDVPFVSGSAKMDAMVILPCSTGTFGRIATGVSSDNITRGADVCLKERRPLIVCPRETPLNSIHLENLLKLSQNGATILPTMPSFYTRPQNINQVVDTVVARVLDHLHIDHQLMARWKQDHD